MVAPEIAPDNETEVVKFVLSVPLAELETGDVDELGITPREVVCPLQIVTSAPALVVNGTSIKSTLRLLPPPPSITLNSTVLVEHKTPDQIIPLSAQQPSI